MITDDRAYRARAYRQAQRAIADLKSAIQMLLDCAGEGGMTNSDVGRCLGIYQGHKGHEGHIPRTLLALLEADGTVEQREKDKHWLLKKCRDGAQGSVADA